MNEIPNCLFQQCSRLRKSILTNIWAENLAGQCHCKTWWLFRVRAVQKWSAVTVHKFQLGFSLTGAWWAL